MLNVVETNQFRKDKEKSIKQGKDLRILIEVIGKLLNGISLDKKYKDHSLKGHLKGFRECHLTPDWLLIYQKTKEELRLCNLGSHSELFE